MKKMLLRIVSIVLTIVLFVTSFSGCAAGTMEADASQYLSKGEWFAYFATETDLQLSGTETELPIEEDSQYYTSVMAIVEREIIDAETACKDLDKKVDKDTVAYTCVNYLFDAFRTESKTTFTDEDKITDPKAAAEAVDYGFVEPKSNKKFGPDEYLDIEACTKAIEATIERLTTYEFSEEESNFEIEYQDNVYETNDEVEVISGKISDYTDYTEKSDMVENASHESGNLSVEMLGLRASDEPTVTNTAKEGDVITVKIPKFSYDKNKSAYKVGNIVKLQTFELTTDINRRLDCCFIKITQEPLLDKFRDGYIITGVLPTTDEAIKAVQSGQKSTEKAKNGQITEDSGASGVSGFQITSSGVKFSYTSHAKGKVDLKNGRSDKTDPTLEGDLSFSIEISDIKLTTTGFDTIFLDALFGKPHATLGIKYTTTVDASASFPQTRLAPYNNGNGKFPSNLSRSRLTTGNGAKDIKIGKVKYAFGPLVAELGLYLQVYLDGHIEVKLTKESNTTYTITKNGIEKTASQSKQKLEADFEVNLYAGVELRGDVHIVGFSCIPICDMKARAGFEMQASGSFYVLTEEGTYTDKTSTNISGDELKATTTAYKNTSFGYCLNVKLDFKIYGEIASGDCIIGKVVKIFNRDYESAHASRSWNIFEYHWEDGKKVDHCTRKPDSKTKEKEVEAVAGSKFDISDYSLRINSGSCGQFYVTQVPCQEKNKKKTLDSIVVASTDENVCTATYYKENNMVEVSAVNEGTCEVIIMTEGGYMCRFLKCAILVNDNDEVSFVPSESGVSFIQI